MATYQEFIDSILETRGRFACGNEYHERHHIVPKCIGGTNDEDNLIDLFAREHFEAHRLLALENPDVQGLVYAWWAMSIQTNQHTEERYRLTPEEYEESRIAVANIQKGKHLSEETKKKLSDALKGRAFSDETRQKMSQANKGREWSEEQKINFSISRKGKKIKPHSEEAKKKISLSQMGEKNHRYGKHHTKEHKKMLSEINKGENNHFYGKHHTDEVKNNLSKMRSKAVRCVETEVIYDSAIIAQEKTGIRNSSIGKCCNGKQETAGGYHWEFVVKEIEKDI